MVKDSLPTQTKIFSSNRFFRPEIWIKREGSETGIIQKLDPSLETKKMGHPRGLNLLSKDIIVILITIW